MSLRIISKSKSIYQSAYNDHRMKTEEESTLDTSCEIQVDYTSENGCQTYFFSYNESTNVTNLYRVTSLQVRFQDSEETVFYHDA